MSMQAKHAASFRRDGTQRRLSLAAAGMLTALVLTSAGTPAQEGGRAKVDETRAVLAEWVQTQRLISKEGRQWTVSREFLGDRIEVVRREIAALRVRIGEAQESISEADRKRAELVASHAALKGASDSLRATIGTLETRTRTLAARFPEPLSDLVRPLSQRLPDADAGQARSEQSLSERFLTVVGILKFANKFNRDITVGSELLTLPDGSAAEVRAMYLGLGQAWYANAKGTVGGLGAASSAGWNWTPMDAAAGEIARALAIHGNQEPAAFVQLPVRVEQVRATEK